VKRGSTGTTQYIEGQDNSGGTIATASWNTQFNADNTVEGFVGVGSTGYIAKSTALTDTTSFHHIALVRYGSTLTIYVDGVAGATTANLSTNSINSSPNKLAVGRDGEYVGGYFNGWIDEYRVSKGIARWTSNFTPPTIEYASDSYTVLLLHMDGSSGSTTFTDSSGVTGPDFSIGANPTSQTIGSGSQASSLLTFTSQSSYSGTVNIAVTSGCSVTGMSCSFAGSITSVSVPSGGSAPATLNVLTSLTTPGGTYPIVVTGTDSVNSALTHTVTFTVTVNAPQSFPFSVKTGATQIVVTVTWSGSGTTSVSIAYGGTTYPDTGAVTYDRTSIAVATGQTPTYTSIHRATYTITGITSPETWTLYVSGPSTYTVTVEVT